MNKKIKFCYNLNFVIKLSSVVVVDINIVANITLMGKNTKKIS